jgi:putative SOS response-associated peptidase YedK
MLVAIRSEDGKRVPKMMKWGLIPHWSKDDKLQYSTFNARSEDFRTKPSFRDAWKWGQRCLVVTDGFYEWKKLDAKGKEKQPYAIAMSDHAQMVMAGLWAKWKSPAGEEVLSCTILTCGPNAVMGELHNRMPVILDQADWPKWLGEEQATEGIAGDAQAVPGRGVEDLGRGQDGRECEEQGVTVGDAALTRIAMPWLPLEVALVGMIVAALPGGQ